MNIIFILLICQNIFSKNSEISIWNPHMLEKKYVNKKLKFTIANFGSVPYGHSIYGTVYKTQPSDACTSLESLYTRNIQSMLILYAKSGGCNYSKKALMAQKAGANLLIIGDKNTEDINDKFIIEDNQELSTQIKIPTVIIGKTDSKNFEESLEKNDKNEEIELAFNFKLLKTHDKAVVKFIIQTDDGKGYDALIKFYRYYKKLHDNVQTKVHYKIFKNSNIQFDINNCFKNKNTYCILPEDTNTAPINLMSETMKQLCIYDNNFGKYMNYIQKVKENCFDLNNKIIPGFETCTNKIYMDIFDHEFRVKMDDCMNIKNNKIHKLFDKNNDKIKYYILNYSPLIFVNDSIYKGNYYDSLHLAKTVCDSFEEVPETCKKLTLYPYYEGLKPEKLHRFLNNVLIVFVASICLILILFYIIYKRRLKKYFETELEARVKHALMEYNNDKTQDQPSES